ncbi:FeoB-associated Cys-rich membrane protein [Maridesulfovibrio sp.]|uniref:FeoB-associated Cys-rich membrane protein n=1 Tax=Maridesulfovibrio sp. TaxID=2795000 RepID=UPI0029CA1387|nr:FeoB-associated Cys-rich membrane protein [Maridesulfovibrio sp.]
MENIVVFGAVGIAVVYLVRKWFGKGGGSCGCGCDCGCDCSASKNGGCSTDSETCVNDLRQK